MKSAARRRQAARERYARALERQGPEYRRVADSLRAGFENIWIAPALDAIEDALRNPEPDDLDDD